MIKQLTKLIFSIVILGCSGLYAAEFCSKQTISQRDPVGIWKGSDSYYLKLRINDKKQLCISIGEDNSVIARNVRDIIIIDGKLKHFTYYTPSTDGFVIYANIIIENNEMRFDWFSTYDKQVGTDVYYRQEKK